MHMRYNRDPSAANMHFMDEKTREANMFERNCYMFFTFIMLIIILEKFCQSYFSLWKAQSKMDFLTNHTFSELEKEEKDDAIDGKDNFITAQEKLGPNTPQELPLSQKDKEYLKKTE